MDDEPLVPDLLETFCACLGAGRRPATRARHRRVCRQLEAFLDGVALDVVAARLGESEALLLAAERVLEPAGALWRTFDRVQVVACLPAFVHDPWVMERAGDARVQAGIALRWGQFLLPRATLRADGFRIRHDALRELERARAEMGGPQGRR